jgi:hypothetical protein
MKSTQWVQAYWTLRFEKDPGRSESLRNSAADINVQIIRRQGLLGQNSGGVFASSITRIRQSGVQELGVIAGILLNAVDIALEPTARRAIRLVESTGRRVAC